MRIGKSIIKKVALILAGVAAITGVGFGVKAIVDYTKEDLKTISPNFEVGNLGSDGKFVDDETTLYTKEAFACYGLQVKPDFDSEVNYKIYYYDILDNYISSTSSLSDGYSGEAPLNGAYARMVIEPKEDEDGKISWTEKISYPNQLTVKVKKEQKINERFVNFKGQLMQVVSDTGSLVFTNNLHFNWNTLEFEKRDNYCVTSTTLLKVDGGSTFNFNVSKLSEKSSAAYCRVFQFKGFPLEENLIPSASGYQEENSFVLNKQTKYIFITVDQSGTPVAWTDNEIFKLPSCFTVTKTK